MISILFPQSSADYTAFATTREAEVIGAKFSVRSDRDHTGYFVTVPRHHAEKAAEILASSVTSLHHSTVRSARC